MWKLIFGVLLMVFDVNGGNGERMKMKLSAFNYKKDKKNYKGYGLVDSIDYGTHYKPGWVTLDTYAGMFVYQILICMYECYCVFRG